MRIFGFTVFDLKWGMTSFLTFGILHYSNIKILLMFVLHWKQYKVMG